MESKFSSQTQFPEGCRPPNLVWSGAARNVQNFGCTTCTTHVWWFSGGAGGVWARFKIQNAFRFFLIWLVETGLENWLGKEYYSPAPAPCGPRFGPIFLVGKFHIFGPCSRFKPWKEISFCPVPQKYMRIQILKGRGLHKFVVKSSSGPQVRPMVVKIQIFMKIHDFVEILWRADRAHELNFRRVLDPKILCGPALRAMFKISAAPRVPLMCGDFMTVLAGMRAWFKIQNAFLFFIIWLVETGFRKLAWKGIFFSGTGAMWAKIWADIFGSKISHFWHVLKI